MSINTFVLAYTSVAFVVVVVVVVVVIIVIIIIIFFVLLVMFIVQAQVVWRDQEDERESFTEERQVQSLNFAY